MRRLAAIAIALATAGAARSDDWSAPPPLWEGSWRGTIGALPVHLCLDTTPSRNHGAYYNDRSRRLIRLELGDDKRTWTEKADDDSAGPRLRIVGQSKDALDGDWSDGKAKLPIRLRRIGPASAEFEGPCGSMEFHRPRLGRAAVAKARSTKDGAPLVTWHFKPGAPFNDVDVSTFTLDRPGASIARVNGLLRAVLPRADGTGEWLDCMVGNANANGRDGDYSESIEPTLVTGRWLAATHRSDNYCGGAHPNTDVRFRTFDLELGVEVDPLDWLGPNAVSTERSDAASGILKRLTPAFRKALLAGFKSEGADCDGVLADQEYWTVGIERGSLVFWPQLPRVVMACSEDFKLSFDQLQPWFNAKGKAAAATIARR